MKDENGMNSETPLVPEKEFETQFMKCTCFARADNSGMFRPHVLWSGIGMSVIFNYNFYTEKYFQNSFSILIFLSFPEKNKRGIKRCGNK